MSKRIPMNDKEIAVYNKIGYAYRRLTVACIMLADLAGVGWMGKACRAPG